MNEAVKHSKLMDKADGAILADIIETWEPECIKERCVKPIFFVRPINLALLTSG